MHPAIWNRSGSGGWLTLLCLTGLAWNPSYARSYEALLTHLYDTHREALRAKFSPEYNSLCSQYAIDSSDTLNQRTLLMPMLIHKLMTTSNALDGARGGILETVYFWHWNSPNPRHRILRLPDSTKLTKLPPPKGFGKYKSSADIDRLPAIFLKDMVADSPGYSHPSYGDFYTFGWCSEREMSFSLLAATMGYKFKIKQFDIHVWSELLVDLKTNDGSRRQMVLAFDNTFDTFEGYPLRGPIKTWEQDIGSGKQIKLYNSVPRTPRQIAALGQLDISEMATHRIEEATTRWLASTD